MARKKSLESYMNLYKKSVIKTPKLKIPKKPAQKELKLGAFKLFKFKY
jgi:hypothetical protein